MSFFSKAFIFTILTLNCQTAFFSPAASNQEPSDLAKQVLAANISETMIEPALSSETMIEPALSDEIENNYQANLALAKKVEKYVYNIPSTKSKKYTAFIEKMLNKDEIKAIGTPKFPVEVVEGSLFLALEELKNDPSNLAMVVQFTAGSPIYTFFCKESQTYKIFLLKECLKFFKKNSSTKRDDLVQALLIHELWHIIAKDVDHHDFFINNLLKASYSKIANWPTMASLMQVNGSAMQMRELLADAFSVKILNSPTLITEALNLLYKYMESLGFANISTPMHPVLQNRLNSINNFAEGKTFKDVNYTQLHNYNMENLIAQGVILENSSYQAFAEEIIAKSELKHFYKKLPEVDVKLISLEPEATWFWLERNPPRFSEFKDITKEKIAKWVSLQEGFTPSIGGFNEKSQKFEIYLLNEFFDSIYDQTQKELFVKLAIARELGIMPLNCENLESFALQQILQWEELANANNEYSLFSNLVFGINLPLLKMHSLMMDICAVELLQNKTLFHQYIDEISHFNQSLSIEKNQNSLDLDARKQVIDAMFPKLA